MIRAAVASSGVAQIHSQSTTNTATLVLPSFVGRGELRVCFYGPDYATAWPLRCTAALQGSGPGWLVTDTRGGAILPVDIGPRDGAGLFRLLVRVESRDADGFFSRHENLTVAASLSFRPIVTLAEAD